MIAAESIVMPRGRIVDDEDWRADFAGAAFERRSMRGMPFGAGAGSAGARRAERGEPRCDKSE